MQSDRMPTEEGTEEFIDKLVHLNRVAKVVKGGRRFSFSALVVVGNGEGLVGFGMGKAREVPEAIRKATERAKRNMIQVSLEGTTIPHQVTGRYGAGMVLLKPARPGTGVIAGGPVRAVLEVAGIKDVLTKCIGSRTPTNAVRATVEGLRSLVTKDMIAKRLDREVA